MAYRISEKVLRAAQKLGFDEEILRHKIDEIGSEYIPKGRFGDLNGLMEIIEKGNLSEENLERLVMYIVELG